MTDWLEQRRIVVRVAQDYVVSLLARPPLESLNHLGEERILNIRNDHAQRTTACARQIARMKVGFIPEFSNRGHYHATGALAYPAGAIQHVRNRRSGNSGPFSDMADGYMFHAEKGRGPPTGIIH